MNVPGDKVREYEMKAVNWAERAAQYTPESGTAASMVDVGIAQVYATLALMLTRDVMSR